MRCRHDFELLECKVFSSRDPLAFEEHVIVYS
jgi:hypothetical protein